MDFTRGKTQGRVISNSVEFPFETCTQIYQKGKNVTKMNIVLKKADVLRPKQTDTVNEIESRLNDWKVKQWYLKKSERHRSTMTRKTLLISILLVNVMEHLLKSAAMGSDVEGLE